jgi:hypothetical protein
MTRKASPIFPIMVMSENCQDGFGAALDLKSKGLLDGADAHDMPPSEALALFCSLWYICSSLWFLPGFGLASVPGFFLIRGDREMG